MDPPKYKDGLVVFQVALSEERTRKRLRDMKPYSSAAVAGTLFNCANLVSYLLGLTRSNKYLPTCVVRSDVTRFREMLNEIKAALEACGKPSEGVVMSDPLRVISDLASLDRALLPGYATNLIVYTHGKPIAHSVAIGKQPDGTLLFVDPQVGTPEQYPMTVVGRDAIEAFLVKDGWTHWSCFLAPPTSIIHEVDQERCHTAIVPEEAPRGVTVVGEPSSDAISRRVRELLAARAKPGGRKRTRRRKLTRRTRKKRQ